MSYKDKINLKNKSIVLIGGTGILGLSYVNLLNEFGANLLVADVNYKNLLILKKNYPNIYIQKINLEKENSVKILSKKAIKILKKIDVVICNSALTMEGLSRFKKKFYDFEDYPLDLWNKSIQINLNGPFLVAKYFGKYLRKTQGSLILISSTYGIVGPDHEIYKQQMFKSVPSYSASKAGVIGLTKWLSTYWGKHNVRVNCVSPGGIRNKHNKKFINEYSKRTPLLRMGEKDEISGIILYLCSDLSSYATGQNFIIDGGWTAR
jgi:NAD(P)-dependent dehydrogenase (short-subunit alcohol dehydrogenase family)